MPKKLREWIKRKLSLYDIEDLKVGAHCGLCSKWLPKEIVPSYWPWSACSGECPIQTPTARPNF